MRIAHFGPFAPHRCGLYETAREMVRAATMQGHDVAFVDTGVDGRRNVHGSDERTAFTLRTSDYHDVRSYDLFVISSEIPGAFLAETTASVVRIMHGRPLSSFRLTATDKKAPVYDVYANAAKNERCRLFVTLWEEHLPYWRVLVPAARLRSTDHPPCDLTEFNPGGALHTFKPEQSGKLNVLVADLWRPDCEPFQVAHGLIEAAPQLPGLKVHFYGCNTNPGPWQHIFRHMRSLGILGETCGMMKDIATVYRACDFVVTQHAIATRILREALACGTPIVAPQPCRYTPYRFVADDSNAIALAVQACAADVATRSSQVRLESAAAAQRFDLNGFGKRLCAFYSEALA